MSRFIYSIKKTTIMATELIKRNNMFFVPFSKLKVLDNFNDREDYGTVEEMNELAESIYHQGVKVPIKGYKEGDVYVVIQGHRRFRAGQMIKKKYNKTVIYPLMTYPVGTTNKDLLLDTLLTNSGKDLTPLEKASTVSKLLAEKATVKEIASALGGVSEVYVKNLQRLWTIPDNAKKLIREGVVAATLIMSVLKNKNANLEEWIAEIEKQAGPDTGDKKKGKGSKKKTAKVTAKNAPKTKADSMKEFKRFIKQNPGQFESKAKQAAFEFFVSILENKASYSQILEYFTGK
jgi:ParB/RepB/Spo0J family partition protein